MSRSREVAAASFGRRNLIINGAMQVAQRGTSATVSDGSNEGYSTVDRMNIQFNTAMGGSATVSQSSTAPTGFNNSLKVQVASTTTVTSSQALDIIYYIEAQDLQPLGAGSVDANTATLSFWAKTDNSFTDQMSVQFYTPDATEQYYIVAFTPSTSWTRHTITLPDFSPCTINNDNGQGLRIIFKLCQGGTYSGSAPSDWQATRIDSVTGTNTTFMSSTSNAFYLTGVQLEVGSTATAFEHRSYGEELALCQRYFYRWGYTDATGASGTIPLQSYSVSPSGIDVWQGHPVEMRARPSITTNGSWASSNVTNFSGRFQNRQGFSVRCNVAGNANTFIYANSSDDYFDIDAEL